METITEVRPVQKRLRISLSDGSAWWLYPKEWRQLALQEGDEVDPEQFARQVLLIQYPRGLKLAVAALAKRACSTEEIRRLLARNHYCEEAQDMVLCKLEKGGYLNDRAFCEQWIHYRSSGSYGAARIRQELRRKGVSESEVSEAMESVSEEDQVEAAAVLARRKRRQLGPAEDPYKTKSKIIQYLVRRGFSWDVAKKAYDLTENDE